MEDDNELNNTSGCNWAKVGHNSVRAVKKYGRMRLIMDLKIKFFRA
jgi:hypothetical protein